MRIKSIDLRVVYNSFGKKTIEAVINSKFRASSPSGTSKSEFEAREIEPEIAIRRFNKIKGLFIGNFTQREFDELLQRYINEIGTAATTALSLAFFSSRKMKEKRVPYLIGNVMGGGKHSFGLSRQKIQEILVITRNKSIRKQMEISSEIWHEVRKALMKRKALLGLNHEFAWLHKLRDEEALRVAREIASSFNVRLGVDVAADHFSGYRREKQVEFIKKLITKFELYYVEDPFRSDDFKSFGKLTHEFGSSCLICGDDLIASRLERLEIALRYNAVNAVIVKPNQVGTITACLDLMKMARENKIEPVVSHRSQETCCAVLAKLAVLANYAKISVCGIDIEKRNELLRLLEG